MVVVCLRDVAAAMTMGAGRAWHGRYTNRSIFGGMRWVKKQEV